MRTVLAPRKADDVTLLQHMLTFGRAQRRLAAEHDHPFLVQVVRVVGPELAARLDLGHGRADQLTADALADERALGAPALAVPRPVPLVAVEVESLHSASLRRRAGGTFLRVLGEGDRRFHTARPWCVVPRERPVVDRLLDHVRATPRAARTLAHSSEAGFDGTSPVSSVYSMRHRVATA